MQSSCLVDILAYLWYVPFDTSVALFIKADLRNYGMPCPSIYSTRYQSTRFRRSWFERRLKCSWTKLSSFFMMVCPPIVDGMLSAGMPSAGMPWHGMPLVCPWYALLNTPIFHILRQPFRCTTPLIIPSCCAPCLFPKGACQGII